MLAMALTGRTLPHTWKYLASSFHPPPPAPQQPTCSPTCSQPPQAPSQLVCWACPASDKSEWTVQLQFSRLASFRHNKQQSSLKIVSLQIHTEEIHSKQQKTLAIHTLTVNRIQKTTPRTELCNTTYIPQNRMKSL